MKLFPLFQNICKFGKSFFANDGKNLNILIEIACRSMFAKGERVSRINHSEGTLLLQLIVQHFHEILST